MSLLHIAGGATEDKLDASDVFSAYVRTGTGADVVVNTGIDYTKGFMSWTKGRSGATDHAIYDSARGVTKDLVSNSTAAQTTQTTGLKSVNTTGHTIGSLAKMNTSGATYVDWVFRKAPKFFDIVTYTGNGVAGRQIPHNLGCEVGMIIVKCTSTTSHWAVWNRGAPTGYFTLNSTNAADTTNAKYIFGDGSNVVAPTSNVFTTGGGWIETNTNGATYVAYLFAHDPSADGIIQCGSYVGNAAAAGPIINLGWEPQYVLVKAASAAGNWTVLDSMRALNETGGAYLRPNTTSAEVTVTSSFFRPLATGFQPLSASDGDTNNPNGTTFIYLAIRRPNKVPTSGTQVYSAIARTGTGATTTVTGVGFAPDMLLASRRTLVAQEVIYDRLRGKNIQLRTASTEADLVQTDAVMSYDMDGVSLGADTNNLVNPSGLTLINHFFKRAPKFMDIVCYTGTGVARTVNHNLGVVPELMIVKSRNGIDYWTVYHQSLGALKVLELNTTVAVSADNSSYWNSSSPSLTNLSVGTNNQTNGSAKTYVAYLFTTLNGISKVGSYTGNGTSQTIPCGFSTGARFVLIKRTNSTGDWYIWDTARGIVAANDPHLSLNTTSAEVATDDSIDPESSGFIVNQVAATNINVTSATYIFLAIA